MKKLSKRSKALIIIGAVLLVIFIALMIFYFGASYKQFDSISKNEVRIPGLKDGFVPQGLAYSEQEDVYLVSGYMNKGGDSRIYTVDKSDGKARGYATLSNTSEANKKGHLGGIATVKDNVWIATDGHVLRLNIDDLINASNSAVDVVDEFATINNASFCFATDTALWVGEFYMKGKYNTDESHIVTDNGITNNAIACEYAIDGNKEYGLRDTTAMRVLSIPQKVQGFSITGDNKIVLSTSYGISNSQIFIYDSVLVNPTVKKITIAEKEYPLYILTPSVLLKTIKTPAMSEGIDYYDGRVHILFESACKKYKWVNRTRTKNIVSIAV